MNLSPLPIQKFFDNNGRPLASGKLFTYASGTSTKIATYVDAAGALNTNPIILDFRGECRLWIDPTKAYTFVLAPATDTDPPTAPIWTVNDITVAPANSDNAAVDTGSVNNIVLAIPQISSPVAFTRIVFKAANSNTGATTITINGGTSKALTWQPNGPLSGGEIIVAGIYEAVFDGAQWQLQGPTLDVGDVRLYGAKGDGVTDDRAAIQAAVNAITARGGGRVKLQAGSFLIRRVAAPDGLFNGIHIPFTNVFGYANHLEFVGEGRATVLLAGDNSMIVLRHSDSNNFVWGFAIDGNGKTAVTGLALFSSDTTAVGLVQHIDHNDILVDIRNCAEGVQLECPSGGGCYYNTFWGGIWQDNTRHIRMRDHAVAKGPNRNLFKALSMIGGNCGVYIDGTDTTMLDSCTFEGIGSGVTPMAVPTAIFINNVGSLGAASSADTNIIECQFESNTRDLDCNNARTSILGGTCGNQEAGGVFGAIAGTATPDAWIGGDRDYQLRELAMGGSSSVNGLRIQPGEIPAFSSTQCELAVSSNQGGAYPFDADSHLIIRGRPAAGKDIVLITGASSTVRAKLTDAGELTLLAASLSEKTVSLVYGVSVAIDLRGGNNFVLTVTNNTAFTIQQPTNDVLGKNWKLTIINTSGGAMGAITWSAAYKMSAWTNPANAFNRTIEFQVVAASFERQVSQTGVDVPN